MAALRRPVQFNRSAKSWTAAPLSESLRLVEKFHSALPYYKPTRLVRLDEVAKEVGVKSVYMKDESDRFGLPSFKILGASWGTFRALTRELELPLDVDLAVVKQAAMSYGTVLFAATDGNHGRAVARMASILSITAQIHVPADMQLATIELIRGEGAKVVVCSGNYDDTVLQAQEAAAEHSKGVLIQDFAFNGYEDIPQWIVEGYSTMMCEIDRQLEHESGVDLVVVPVGVGSFAQAVVSHFKQKGSSTAVLTSEPDTAACLWKSLRQGRIAKERTSHTIMAGLECGTVSTTAWPLLRSGVDASLTISDYESHLACSYLASLGESAGPCGAATLAALRRLTSADKAALGLTEQSVVLLMCTEGTRAYPVPRSVFTDDAVTLAQTLVQINSANPTLGFNSGPGETEIARYITAWLEHRDIESHWIESIKGRPSILGVVRGSGGGKSLMYTGHIDTVSFVGYEGDPMSGKIEDDYLYGRGAGDMKGGIAAGMVALAAAKTLGLRGDVIFAGVADEEAFSIGTQDVLQAGWRADGAIVSEPSSLDIGHAHKGFVWLEVNIYGFAAHGSDPALGVDAIAKAGYFLVELDRYAQRLQQHPEDPELGPPSVHASIIKGGQEESTYPALCTVTIERRTVIGETVETVKQELQSLLEKLAQDVPDFKFDLKVTFDRPPFQLPRDHPFSMLVGEVVGKFLAKEPTFRKFPYWTDCALFAAAGVPALLWGPSGEGLHASSERVSIVSVSLVAKTLAAIAAQFCA